MGKNGVDDTTKGSENEEVGSLGWVNCIPEHIFGGIFTHVRVRVAQECCFKQACSTTPTSRLLKPYSTQPKSYLRKKMIYLSSKFFITEIKQLLRCGATYQIDKDFGSCLLKVCKCPHRWTCPHPFHFVISMSQDSVEASCWTPSPLHCMVQHISFPSNFWSDWWW